MVYVCVLIKNTPGYGRRILSMKFEKQRARATNRERYSHGANVVDRTWRKKNSTKSTRENFGENARRTTCIVVYYINIVCIIIIIVVMWNGRSANLESIHTCV